MTLGLRDSRTRRRRRFWAGVVKILLVLIGIGALGFYAYHTGSRLAEHDVTVLREEIAQLTATNEALVRENEALKADLVRVNRQATEWQGRYQREVPTGEIKELADLVAEKVRAGVAVDRLTFLIESAGSIGACDNRPETKRFIMPTPLYEGANSFIGFADSTITVTGMGESARNESGEVEGWFDPAAPVTLRFTKLGGEQSEVAGKLPLHHSVLVGDAEYRFTAMAGARGFIEVTGDRCKLTAAVR
jgi:hypothetical protein